MVGLISNTKVSEAVEVDSPSLRVPRTDTLRSTVIGAEVGQGSYHRRARKFVEHIPASANVVVG